MFEKSPEINSQIIWLRWINWAIEFLLMEEAAIVADTKNESSSIAHLQMCSITSSLGCLSFWALSLKWFSSRRVSRSPSGKLEDDFYIVFSCRVLKRMICFSRTIFTFDLFFWNTSACRFAVREVLIYFRNPQRRFELKCVLQLRATWFHKIKLFDTFEISRRFFHSKFEYVFFSHRKNSRCWFFLNSVFFSLFQQIY